MNASPPLCQPVHPALLWPFQKSLGIVCKQSCHADEELPQDRSRLAGWLEIWSSSIQSSDTTVQHKDSTPECGHATGTFTQREIMAEMYVTLLQTVQIEAHYVARLAMQKRWLKANGNDWTSPGLPFSFKWANLRGINSKWEKTKTSIRANNNSDAHLVY